MRVVPKTINGKISFYASHLPKWAENPEAIGSTPEQIAELQGMLDDVKDAFKQQAQAQNAAQAATLTLKSALNKLTNAGGSAILRVRSKARIDGGKAAYIAASVRPPKNAAPMAVPGTPYKFESSLRPNGTLKFTWRCDNPRGSQGTMYQVSRRFGEVGPYQHIGASGKKQYVDATIPAGTATVCYRIQAVRSTKQGDAAEFIVNLGVNVMPHPMMRAA